MKYLISTQKFFFFFSKIVYKYNNIQKSFNRRNITRKFPRSVKYWKRMYFSSNCYLFFQKFLIQANKKRPKRFTLPQVFLKTFIFLSPWCYLPWSCALASSNMSASHTASMCKGDWAQKGGGGGRRGDGSKCGGGQRQ